MELQIIKSPNKYLWYLVDDNKIIFVSDKLGVIMRLKDRLTK